jgi:hypothetical protein
MVFNDGLTESMWLIQLGFNRDLNEITRILIEF